MLALEHRRDLHPGGWPKTAQRCSAGHAYLLPGDGWPEVDDPEDEQRRIDCYCPECRAAARERFDKEMQRRARAANMDPEPPASIYLLARHQGR